jgi:hypothetical protein
MLNQLIVIMLLMMTLSLSLYILHSSQLLIMVHHRTGGFKVPTHASQALVTTSPPGQRCCYCTEDRKVESLKPPPVHTQRLQAVPFPILQWHSRFFTLLVPSTTWKRSANYYHWCLKTWTSVLEGLLPLHRGPCLPAQRSSLPIASILNIAFP